MVSFSRGPPRDSRPFQHATGLTGGDSGLGSYRNVDREGHYLVVSVKVIEKTSRETRNHPPPLGTPTPFTGTFHLHPQFHPAPEGGPKVHTGTLQPPVCPYACKLWPLGPLGPQGCAQQCPSVASRHHDQGRAAPGVPGVRNSWGQGISESSAAKRGLPRRHIPLPPGFLTWLGEW